MDLLLISRDIFFFKTQGIYNEERGGWLHNCEQHILLRISAFCQHYFQKNYIRFISLTKNKRYQ